MFAARTNDEDGPARAARRRLPAPVRRAVILEAAVPVFAANGYHAASMEEVAAASGVSKAVLYDHFASKRELYVVVLDAVRSDLDATVESALAAIDGHNGEPAVRVAITAFFAWVEQHPQRCRLLFHELGAAGGEAADVVTALEDRVAAGLTATLGADPAIFAGHPRRDRQLAVLAKLLMSAIHGLASWWHRNPDVGREDVVDRVVDFVWPTIERARTGSLASEA